jgi:crossover junction endonuclease EME1
VETEKFVMLVVTADHFIDTLTDPKCHNLVGQVHQLVNQNPGYQIIYLIEGMLMRMRKARSARNRLFTSAVRRPTDGAVQHHAMSGISEDSVQNALVQLQLCHDSVIIHHTDTLAETARWIAIFTQHISTTRYRQHHHDNIGFCVDTGQVRSGENKHDTYVRLLQEISRITAPVASGISAEYNTVTKLVVGLRNNGPMSLEHVKRRNRDGHETETTVGKAVSKRLHSIFTSSNEADTHV